MRYEDGTRPRTALDCSRQEQCAATPSGRPNGAQPTNLAVVEPQVIDEQGDDVRLGCGAADAGQGPHHCSRGKEQVYPRHQDGKSSVCKRAADHWIPGGMGWVGEGE